MAPKYRLYVETTDTFVYVDFADLLTTAKNLRSYCTFFGEDIFKRKPEYLQRFVGVGYDVDGVTEVELYIGDTVKLKDTNCVEYEGHVGVISELDGKIVTLPKVGRIIDFSTNYWVNVLVKKFSVR